MTFTSRDHIPQLDDHEDLADLQAYDFPATPKSKARAVLTAKAWIGEDLGCFFVDQETSDRFVVLFKAYQGFMPGLGGDDMRNADIGALYELSIFVSGGCLPIVDRAECVASRRARR
jgi:hypothetical protein